MIKIYNTVTKFPKLGELQFPSNINKPSLHIFLKKESAKTRVVEELKRAQVSARFVVIFDLIKPLALFTQTITKLLQTWAAIFWSLQ